MNTTTIEPNRRIDLLDALRGSALLGILLLHSIEHWDFTRYPPNPPDWLRPLNTLAHDVVFFLFAGKSYGIFAMMFGVSFFLILDRWSRRGINYRARFLWRLTLLAIFGYLNAVIYCGDVLLILAVMGLPLVLFHKLGNRTLAWIAAALLMQIPSWCQVVPVLRDAAYQPPQPYHWELYGHLFNVFSNGSFFDVCALNTGLGQLARIYWTIETGRYTQMMGLFLCGLLLGRNRVFEDPARSMRLAKHCLLWGVIGFAIVHPIQLHLDDWGLTGMRHYVTENLVSSYSNLAQLAVWVGAFTLLYQWAAARTVLNLLAPYGRMSLTCYVTQGLIGVPLFYGYGLALYRYLGPFQSLLVGVAIFVVQCTLAHWWLKRFAYGPLEWLWRCLTFLSFDTPLRYSHQPAIAEAGRVSSSATP